MSEHSETTHVWRQVKTSHTLLNMTVINRNAQTHTNYLSYNNVCFDFSRDLLVFECLNRVCQHFESSPDLGTALVLHVELLLQRGKELLGKQKIEDVITGTLFYLRFTRRPYLFSIRMT